VYLGLAEVFIASEIYDDICNWNQRRCKTAYAGTNNSKVTYNHKIRAKLLTFALTLQIQAGSV
jgi:hypothetical protein